MARHATAQLLPCMSQAVCRSSCRSQHSWDTIARKHKRALSALQEDIVNALALTGQTLMGQTVMVKSSEVRCTSCAGCVDGMPLPPLAFFAWTEAGIFIGNIKLPQSS